MNIEGKPLDSIFRKLINGHSIEFDLKLCLDDFRILVKSNSPSLINFLKDYFIPFIDGSSLPPDVSITALEALPEIEASWNQMQPDSGKTRIKEEWVDIPGGRAVRKRLTGMVFLFGPDIHLAYGPCTENANQVVNFINNRFLQHHLDRGMLLGHAAGVSKNGRGLALAGFSGMGKSTLALEMVSRGLDFVSNDRLLVEKDKHGLKMLGIAKMPRINPGTAINNPFLASIINDDDRARFSRLAPDALWNLEQKYDVFIHRLFGPGRFVLSSRVQALAILNWSRTGKPVSISLANLQNRPDLVETFRKATGLFYLPGQGRQKDAPIKEYIRVLSDAPVLEISGGVDFGGAARQLEDFLLTGKLGGINGKA